MIFMVAYRTWSQILCVLQSIRIIVIGFPVGVVVLYTLVKVLG